MGQRGFPDGGVNVHPMDHRIRAAEMVTEGLPGLDTHYLFPIHRIHHRDMVSKHRALARHFADAVDHCREQGATWFLAEALLYQGRARADAGAPRAEVEAPVRETLALADAGGYATLARRARAVLDDAPGTP